MKVKESLYTVSLLILLTLFGVSNLVAVHAQPTATCTSPAAEQTQEPNSTNDAADTGCDENGAGDANACIVFGTPVAEGTDSPSAEVTDTPNISADATQEPQDNHQDGEVNDGQQDGETNDGQQDPAYTGTVKVDEKTFQAMTAADRCTALQALTKVTPDAAQATVLKANAGSTVVTVELDVENSYLVYSVQLQDGTDVKVDAGDGSILATQAPDTAAK